MLETETVGPFLVWKLKWGEGIAPLQPCGYASVYGKFLISKKKSLGYEGVVFFKNTFVNIFDFVSKSHSFIRKKSAVKKEVFC